MPEDTKRRNARQQAWQKEHRDRINFLMPKGRKAEIQAAALRCNMGVSEWLNEAIAEKIAREAAG